MDLYRGSGGLVKNLKYVIKLFFHKKSNIFKIHFSFLSPIIKSKHNQTNCQAPLLEKSSYTFFRACQITPCTPVAPHLHTHARTGEVNPCRTPLFFPLFYRAYARARIEPLSNRGSRTPSTSVYLC